MKRQGIVQPDKIISWNGLAESSCSVPSSKRVDKIQDSAHKNYTRSKDFAWKVANGLMAVFFYIAAVLQVNDPDSKVWIMLYIVPAFICCALILFPNVQEVWLFKAATTLHIAVCLVGIIYTIYDGSNEIVKHKTNIFETEEGREAGGLAIVVAWLIVTLKINSKSIQTMTFSSWLKVITVAMLPIALTAVWMYTVDIKLSPKHCKGILSKISQRTK